MIIYCCCTLSLAPSSRTLEDHVKKSGGTVTIHLRKLIKMGVVEANGSAHDPGRTYSIVFKDN